MKREILLSLAEEYVDSFDEGGDLFDCLAQDADKHGVTVSQLIDAIASLMKQRVGA
jgi:hypothetical protein